MPVRIAIIFSIITLLCLLLPRSLYAAVPTETPTPSPTPPGTALTDPAPGEPTCDLCGWCGDKTSSSPPPKPPNWNACHNCLYRADGSEKPNSFYTIIGCISTCNNAECTTSKPGQLTSVLVRSFMTIAFGVVGGIAFLMFLYGASLILTSQGDPLKLENGKDIVTSAIIGLLVVIFSVFLLRTVGFDILQIPGFK